MSTFLHLVARAMLSEHGPRLRDVAVVLPSQRAGVHLRQALAQEAGTVIWSPELFTPSTFVERLSGHRLLPPEELVFEAYEAYREAAAPSPASFGEFLQWAPTALRDMSEADAHLLPLDGFYRDLRSWEDLDWSFNDGPLSAGQERMVRYWAMKGRLHVLLNRRLATAGTGTSGGLERQVAESPTIAAPWTAVWVAGLNALTPAQERVIGRLQEQGLVRLAWDHDRYYVDDPAQEAGLHPRKAIDRFGPGLIPANDGLRADRLHVDVLRAPNKVAQAWCAATALVEEGTTDHERTAIVLADERLLQPLLEALPADIGAINITMGLPIADLPVGTFLEAVIDLHAGHRPGTGYFRSDVERLLLHPFVRSGTGDRAVLAALGERTFIPAFLVQDALAAERNARASDAQAVFAAVEDIRSDMPVRMVHALAWARPIVAEDAFATEQLYQAALMQQRVHALLQRYEHPLDMPTYAAIMRRLLRAARITLFGEPLKGLQVMGMLEARALDMERVIVVGAEEGALPSGGQERSFVPFELRRAHGLPLHDSSDAVQAYNFLRLLQRTKHAVLIHPETEGSAGPSRFIQQLRHELFHTDPARIRTRTVSVAVPSRPPGHIALEKTPTILAATRDRLARGLSPTALGDWLRCPLDFHFKHVLGLREPPVAGARIGSDVLGSTLHEVLEACYRPWIGEELRAEHLEAAASGIGEALRQRLAAHLPADVLRQGQPLLQTGMATRAAERFLLHEARTVRSGAAIIPQALELPLEGHLIEAARIAGSPVLLKGRLDRVDVRNGEVHILDLKTGRVDPRSLEVAGLAVEDLQGEHRYAAQLLVYVLLFLQVHPEVDAVKAGLQPLQRGDGGSGVLLKVAGSDRLTRDIVPVLEATLAEVVRRMLDPAAPIAHDPQSVYCRFCATPP